MRMPELRILPLLVAAQASLVALAAIAVTLPSRSAGASEPDRGGGVLDAKARRGRFPFAVGSGDDRLTDFASSLGPLPAFAGACCPPASASRREGPRSTTTGRRPDFRLFGGFGTACT